MLKSSKKSFVFILVLSLLAPSVYMVSDLFVINNHVYNLPDLRGEPNYNNTFYITPIWESMNSANYEGDLLKIAEMKTKIGPSGDYVKIGFSVSCWYSATITNVTGWWEFDPTDLNYKLKLAADTQTPILFHMNGGNWGACGMQNALLRELWADDNNVQWDQFNRTPALDYTQECLRDRLFSISKDTQFNFYREKFVKQAAKIIENWSRTYPDLFVGCSLDSEIHLDSGRVNGTDLYYDYNPLVIQEYQEWLNYKYLLIDFFNDKYGTNYKSFTEIDAPRIYAPGNVFWELWTEFRQHLIQQAVALQSKWIASTGIPANKIYAHQILSDANDKSAIYKRCDTLITANNSYGVPGYTKYDFVDADRINDINALAGSDWGLFEWNLWHEHNYQLYIMQLKLFYRAGAHVICPNGWEEWTNHGLCIRFDEIFLSALKDFVQQTKDVPRTTAPWAKLTFQEYVYLRTNSNFKIVLDSFWLALIPLGVALGTIITIKLIQLRKKITLSKQSQLYGKK